MELKIKKFYEKQNALFIFAKLKGYEITKGEFISDYKGYMCFAKKTKLCEEDKMMQFLKKNLLNRLSFGLYSTLGHEPAYDMNCCVIFADNSHFNVVNDFIIGDKDFSEEWTLYLSKIFGSEYLDELDFELAHETELEEQEEQRIEAQKNEIYNEENEEENKF